MSRLLLEKNLQRKFLLKIHEESGLSWRNIAEICGISERSLRDWRNEKVKIRYESVKKLCKKTGISEPKPIQILPEYWNTVKVASKGALARYNKYGNPGTLEGRKKGGIESQRRFRLDPEYATKIGAIIRKRINYPVHSEHLAEFIGIILGDGGVTRHQIRITFNRITDAAYSLFLQKIIKRLFGVSAIIYKRRKGNGDDVIISSRNAVDFLLRNGLKTGSKIRNNTQAPRWIFKNKIYKIALIRGLTDTDGSFYLYKHYVNRKQYCNFAMCFTNHSKFILDSFYNGLMSLGFNPTKTRERVYLHKKIDIVKYFGIIRSHNPKHQNKYKRFRQFQESKQ